MAHRLRSALQQAIVSVDSGASGGRVDLRDNVKASGPVFATGTPGTALAGAARRTAPRP